MDTRPSDNSAPEPARQDEPAKGKRAAAKARSRRALIEATLDLIAEGGIAEASVTRIVERSRLSRGMIHLHFESKDELLLECVKEMAARYYEHLSAFVERAGTSPEKRLVAMVEADLDEGVLNERSVAIWSAFRGVARSQAIFARYSDTRDRRLRDLYLTTCAQLIDPETQPLQVARDLAYGTLALLEGMWADYFLHVDDFDRAAAKRIVFRFLAAQLPGRPVFADLVESLA